MTGPAISKLCFADLSPSSFRNLPGWLAALRLRSTQILRERKHDNANDKEMQTHHTNADLEEERVSWYTFERR